LFLLLVVFLVPHEGIASPPLGDTSYIPSKCESCMLFTSEIEATLKRAPKSSSKVDLEATLIDEIDQVCDRMLTYRLHKDKEGLARFSKEFSPTSQIIKDLKARGVDVKMDVPDELLDQPSLESGQLKMDCEWLIEKFEDEIQRWFFKRRHDTSLRHYLCESRYSIGCREEKSTTPDKNDRGEL